MKELYTSPELKLLRLAAEERLAAELDFDDLLASGEGGVISDPNVDIDVPIPGNN